MREKEEGKWVTQMEMIGPREREDRFRFAPKGADVEPTRAFFSRQNIPISRSYWEGENDTCTRREQVSATCWAVDDDKTPSPPHANSIVSVCLSLSLSLSAIAWKAPPLPHCNFICPFLFFSFFSFFFFSLSLDLKLEWKAQMESDDLAMSPSHPPIAGSSATHTILFFTILYTHLSYFLYQLYIKV